MSIGTSGRIVIEIPPETKRELYAVLSGNGQTLKEWFLRCANEYVRTGRQLAIFQDALGSEDSNPEVGRQDFGRS